MSYHTQIQLRVFCDYHSAAEDSDDDKNEFYGRTERDVYRLAREAGWKLYPAQRKAICPACVKAGKNTRAA
jgi:hypothetical protein